MSVVGNLFSTLPPLPSLSGLVNRPTPKLPLFPTPPLNVNTPLLSEIESIREVLNKEEPTKEELRPVLAPVAEETESLPPNVSLMSSVSPTVSSTQIPSAPESEGHLLLLSPVAAPLALSDSSSISLSSQTFQSSSVSQQSVASLSTPSSLSIPSSSSTPSSSTTQPSASQSSPMTHLLSSSLLQSSSSSSDHTGISSLSEPSNQGTFLDLIPELTPPENSEEFDESLFVIHPPEPQQPSVEKIPVKSPSPSTIVNEELFVGTIQSTTGCENCHNSQSPSCALCSSPPQCVSCSSLPTRPLTSHTSYPDYKTQPYSESWFSNREYDVCVGIDFTVTQDRMVQASQNATLKSLDVFLPRMLPILFGSVVKQQICDNEISGHRVFCAGSVRSNIYNKPYIQSIIDSIQNLIVLHHITCKYIGFMYSDILLSPNLLDILDILYEQATLKRLASSHCIVGRSVYSPTLTPLFRTLQEYKSFVFGEYQKNPFFSPLRMVRSYVFSQPIGVLLFPSLFH